MEAKTIFYKVAVLALLTTLAHGRWKTPEEAAASCVSRTLHFSVKKDGSYVFDGESVNEVKNEEGRTGLGTIALTYNTRAGTLEVIEAETRIGDEVIPVGPEFIEYKPMATNLSAFDQLNQLKISFPKVEVGAKLYLKMHGEVKEVPIAGHFDTFQEFGDGFPEDNTSSVISSELPIEFVLNDPTGALAKHYEISGGLHTLTVWLVKPVYNELTNEEANSFVPLKNRTWLMVSTTKTYGELAGTIVKEYDRITSQPLPSQFEDIFQAAKQKKQFVETANTITSMLADKLRYMGDWRPVKGGHIPRPLAEIASTHFGDCKDMAALTTAILRKLGYDASVAWVYRSSAQHESAPLVNVHSFNHAIVKVEKDGRSYWLDPTNPFSFAQGIPSDICDRQAVVLDAAPHAEQIANPSSEDSVTLINCTMEFAPNGDANAKCDLFYNGSAAAGMAGSERSSSKKQLEDNLTNYIACGKFVVSKKFGDFDLKSRIVSDVHFEAELLLKAAVSKSTAGFLYSLSCSAVAQFQKIDPVDLEADLLMGVPRKAVQKTVLRNVKLVGVLPEPCSVDSPWFRVSREVRVNGENLEVEEQVVHFASTIPNSAIKSGEFARVQAELQDKFADYALIFTTLAVPSTTPVTPQN
jgi:hypothetical protein